MTPERRVERTEPRRASPTRTLVLSAVFVATLVAATVSWAQVVTHLRDVVPLETRGTPAAIVWSDRVFRSEAEFARWLRGRGISYERWVKTHPKAVAILRKRDRAAVPAARQRARNEQTVAARPSRRPSVDHRQRVSRTGTIVVLTVLVVAALAFFAALGTAVRDARRARRAHA